MKLVKQVYAQGFANQNEPPKLKDLEIVFGRAVSAILALAGMALVLMLIFSGIKLITAGGDPAKAAQARSSATTAILGLVLVALAYLIIALVARFALGTNFDEITNFRIYLPG